jgi:hypothetical protein
MRLQILTLETPFFRLPTHPCLSSNHPQSVIYYLSSSSLSLSSTITLSRIGAKSPNPHPLILIWKSLYIQFGFLITSFRTSLNDHIYSYPLFHKIICVMFISVFIYPDHNISTPPAPPHLVILLFNSHLSSIKNLRTFLFILSTCNFINLRMRINLGLPMQNWHIPCQVPRFL